MDFNKFHAFREDIIIISQYFIITSDSRAFAATTGAPDSKS